MTENSDFPPTGQTVARVPKRSKKQHQDFNNALQEILDEPVDDLLKLVFGLDRKRTAQPPAQKKSHRTLARDPDLLLGVLGEDGEIAEIFHGEIHLKDEEEVSWRAQEYAAIESRRFKKKIRLHILYIGRGKSRNILPKLDCGDLKTRIKVQNMQDFKWRDFLKCNKPGEVVWAILADFAKDDPQKAVPQIMHRIRQLSTGGEQLARHFAQLEILSHLRNLQPEIRKNLPAMIIEYDLETDMRFLEGKAKGIAEGKAKGIAEGKAKGKAEGEAEGEARGEYLLAETSTFNMLDKGFDTELIAGILDKPQHLILKIKALWELDKQIRALAAQGIKKPVDIAARLNADVPTVKRLLARKK